MERELQFLFSVSRRIALALVAFICLCKVENIDKSLPWKNKEEKADSCDSQSGKISQYLLIQGQILEGAACLHPPFKSEGNEDAQHFQGRAFAISAFYKWHCPRTTNSKLSEAIDWGLMPWRGSDPMQNVVQARYLPQGMAAELQTLQHHFLCRGCRGVFFYPR